MLRTLACAVSLMTAVVLGAAHATSAPNQDQSASQLSDLETGRLLIRAGRLEHARAFLGNV